MKHDAQGYFDRARGWALDSEAESRRSRRTAWTVAGGACAVAMLEAVALAMLVPLKSVSPMTLLVDRTTGYVQAVDPTSAAPLRADEALVQSLLAQYVAAREGYDRATLAADYRKTALWSAEGARNSYLSAMTARDGGVAARFSPGDSVAVTVKSVSQVARDTALVRFDTVLSGSDGRSQPAGSWIAVIRYRFSDGAMSYEDRLLNPLGLQVFGYRRDAERPEFPPPAGRLAGAAPVPAAGVRPTSAGSGAQP